MQKRIAFPVLIMICVLLAGCSTGQSVDPTEELQPVDLARIRLTAYLDALSQGNYERAAEDFGGELAVLQGYNPDVPADDLPGLLERACEVNGFQCLPIKKIVEERQIDENEFVFTITFVDQNGELFVLGPCCGADETEMPPVSEFEMRVIRENDSFLVSDLPPYVP